MRMGIHNFEQIQVKSDNAFDFMGYYVIISSYRDQITRISKLGQNEYEYNDPIISILEMNRVSSTVHSLLIKMTV